MAEMPTWLMSVILKSSLRSVDYALFPHDSIQEHASSCPLGLELRCIHTQSPDDSVFFMDDGIKDATLWISGQLEAR